MKQTRLMKIKEEQQNINLDIKWRILIIVLASICMTLVSVSIVNVALPSIQKSLNASQSALQWILSGYALTFGVTLIAAGRAGDIMGRGGLFILGVFIFSLSSILAGFAPNSTWLNIARFIQGVASGIINPQGLGMIQEYFKGAERGRAFGFFGTTVGASVAIGPVLGGLIIEIGGVDIGWRLTFLINVPIGILTLILAYKWFPKPLFYFGTEEENLSLLRRIIITFKATDPIGSFLIGLTVLAFLFPFMESHGSIKSWLLVPLSLLLLFIWYKWEDYYKSTGKEPMVNLSIFKTPSFSNGAIIMTLYFLGMTSIWIIIALYLQLGLGMTAFEASIVGVPAAVMSSLAADWAGRRVMRYGRKLIIWGIVVAISSLFACMVVVLLAEKEMISIWWWLLTLGVFGIAQGVIISPNQTLTLAEVPIEYAGSSAAVMQTGQRIGTSIGIAIITAVLFSTLNRTSWEIAVLVSLSAIILILFVVLFIAIRDLKVRKT